MRKEIWKDIPGYEGYYQVSNWGRVKSLDHMVKQRYGLRLRKGRLLKTTINNHGYEMVMLSKSSKVKIYTVHRLVAMAFIPNPNNFNEINHKDENKQNNHAENLEWCSHDYNVKYGTGLKRMGIGHSDPLLQLTPDGEFIKEFTSSYHVKRELGFDPAYIRRCCNGKYNYAYGYRWEFK